MNNFYLFFFKKEVKQLLLDELEIKIPSLNLSFSNKSFISMKGDESIFETLKKMDIIFATRIGIFKAKVSEKPEISSTSVQVSESQWWCYEKLNNHQDTFDYVPSELPAMAPARAYFKIKEAHEIFKLNIKSSDSIIEIGSAPGGISYYLLELGVKLISIDPALMEPHLLEQYADRFTHLKESIFDIQSQHLPRTCDWFISDLNLDGDLNINQSAKIIKMYPKIKGAFITIKTPRSEDINRISKWTIGFKQKFKVNIINLPSHRREIGLVLTRK
jgi:hypothetical protein